MTPAYVDNTTTGPPWAWNLGNAFEYNGGPFQPHCWLGCSVSVTCDEATRKWTLAINAGLYRLYVESQPYYCNFGLTSIIPLHVNDDGYFQGQLEVHVPLNLDTSSPYCETECVVNLTFNPDLAHTALLASSLLLQEVVRFCRLSRKAAAAYDSLQKPLSDTPRR